ncbi:MAG: ABC transporter substrate-binding protein [Xanthomonadaceae bacterium]|jgi:phospholipid transport system substrate-binding protein|nr:ABC transporter substrate-binding protein [Xanthomonadaceae bacterium]
MKYRLLSIAFVSALAALSPAGASAQQAVAPVAASTSASASQTVLRNSTEILSTLQQRRAEFRSNPNALRQYIDSELNLIFDREYSARLVLGVHARGASDVDVKAFADAMADRLMQRYGDTLLNFDGKPQFRAKSESPLPGNRGVRVSTELIRQGNEPTPVDYLLRQVDGQWKIFDVMIEGISYVQTFRNQFDAPLRRKSIAQVTAELRGGGLQLNDVK